MFLASRHVSEWMSVTGSPTQLIALKVTIVESFNLICLVASFVQDVRKYANYVC